MKRLIIDLDYTLSCPSHEYSSCGIEDIHHKYEQAFINSDMVQRINGYKSKGYEIVIFSARNMNSYDGKIGLINIHTLPRILEWLKKNNIAYDEVIVGKPWCGTEGFYVDDRSIRPSEFMKLSLEQIHSLLERECFNGSR